jgi:imidazolonepropionase-like amidohydrolase
MPIDPKSTLPLLAVTLALATPLTCGAPAAAEGVLAIEGATLLDGTGSPALDDAVVLVDRGRITAIGSAGELAVPEAARRIDARGRFLVPGFVETHAHLAVGPVSFALEEGVPVPTVTAEPELAPLTLRALLAHGVTTMRDPGGDTQSLVRIRAAAAAGERPGPSVLVAGSILDRNRFDGLAVQVTTPEEVRAEVDRQAAAGVDFVKLYAGLEPALLAAGIERAHVHGLPAIAHAQATSWTAAAELGIDQLLHILPGSADLLPEAEREAYAAEIASGKFLFTWFRRADLDGPLIREMIDALVAHGVGVDPTLVLWETTARADEPAITESADLALVPPSLIENWRGGFHFNLGWTPEDFVAAEAAFQRALELTRRLHEASVALTAGTDANNPWVPPGPSFHRELELLAASGIPPDEVLTIATRNGAAALGVLADRGTLEPGKRADMVLLAADPTRDIRSTRKIEWVMKEGVLHRPEELLPARVTPPFRVEP